MNGLAWTSELGDGAQAVINRIVAGERVWASILALLLVLSDCFADLEKHNEI
jgi:hypothetical protein